LNKVIEMDSFSVYVFLTSMVLALFIVFSNKGYTKANRFLGGYFFFTSFFHLIMNVGFYSSSGLWVTIFVTNAIPVYFLIGPFAFFYMRSILTDDPTLTPYDYLHFTPFVIQLAGMVPYYLTSPEYKKSLATIVHSDNWNLTSSNYYNIIPVNVNLFIRLLHLVVYLLLIFIMLRKYKKVSGIKAYYSHSVKFTERWLIIFCVTVAFFLITTIYMITNHFLHPGRNEFLSNNSIYFSSYGLILLLPILGLLSFPEILYGLPRIGPIVHKDHEEMGNKNKVKSDEEVTISNKGIPDEEIHQFTEINHKLKEAIAKTRPYLDQDFSIYSLAIEMKVPVYHLRYYFQRHGLSFTVYKNRLRVTHAKTLLRAGDFNKFNIEGIGRFAGFSSRASFFTEFRKETGMSPMEYARLKQTEM
jgi:AraC-like DNA-binding protein